MNWQFWRRRRTDVTDQTIGDRGTSAGVQPAAGQGTRVTRHEWRALPVLRPVVSLRPPALAPVLRPPQVAGVRSIIRAVPVLRHRAPAESAPGRVTGLVSHANRAVPPRPAQPRATSSVAATAEPAAAGLYPDPADMPLVVPAPQVVTVVESSQHLAEPEPPVSRVVPVAPPRPTLIEATDEYVAPPVEPKVSFHSISPIERLTAQYETMGLDAVMGMMGLGFGGSSVAAPPLSSPEALPPPVVHREPTVRRRPTLGQARRMGVGSASETADDLPAEEEEPVDEQGSPRDGAVLPRRTASVKPVPRKPVTVPEPVVEEPVQLAPQPSAGPVSLQAPLFRRPPQPPGGERRTSARPISASPSAPADPDTPLPIATPPSRPRASRGTTGRTSTSDKSDVEGEAPPEPRRTVPAVEQPMAPVEKREQVLSDTTQTSSLRAEKQAPATGTSTPSTRTADSVPTANRAIATNATQSHVEPRHTVPVVSGRVGLTPLIDSNAGLRHLAAPRATSASPVEASAGPVYRAALPAASVPPPVRERADDQTSEWTEVPVPTTVVHLFQQHLNVDVSQVPVHRGRAVSRRAATLGARAYTAGGRVYLPDEAGGIDEPRTRALLGHELAHAVQQRVLTSNLPEESSADGRELEAVAGAVEDWIGGTGLPPAGLLHRTRPAERDIRLATGLPQIESLLQRAAATAEAPATQESVVDSSAAREPDQVVSWTPDNGFVDGPAAEPAAGPSDFAPVVVGAGSFAYDGELARAFAEIAGLRESLAGLRTPRPGIGVTATVEVDELADQLYEHIRSRLRAELIIDRERAGMLADAS